MMKDRMLFVVFDTCNALESAGEVFWWLDEAKLK